MLFTTHHDFHFPGGIAFMQHLQWIFSLFHECAASRLALADRDKFGLTYPHGIISFIIITGLCILWAPSAIFMHHSDTFKQFGWDNVTNIAPMAQGHGLDWTLMTGECLPGHHLDGGQMAALSQDMWLRASPDECMWVTAIKENHFQLMIQINKL